MRAQQLQLQAQTRAAILGALSTTHRTLVATLVGQLAIAPNPDATGTARQINAMLSPSEQQAVLRVDAGALAQAQTIAFQMQAEVQSQLTPDQRSALQRQAAKMKADLQQLSPEQRTAMERQAAQLITLGPPGLAGMMTPGGLAQDAGSVLLRALTLPSAMPLGFSSAQRVVR